MIRFKQFLLEKLSPTEIESIHDELIKTVPNLEQVLLLQLSPNTPELDISLLDVNRLYPNPGKTSLFKADEVLKNYRYYFKDHAEFEDGEILKFEFSGYEWFMLIMGTTKDGDRLAHMAFSPDLNQYGLINKVGKILRSNNFKLFPQKDKKELHESLEFIDNLVNIFRNIAGRYYNSSMFPEVKKKYEMLKNTFPKEYQAFLKRKEEVLGNGVNAIRRVGGISPDSVWKSLEGKDVKLRDLNVGDKVYYSPGGRIFSQWAQKEVTHGLGGIISSDAFEVEAFIPTSSIVYTNVILPAGFSPHVGEGEVIVEHYNNEVDTNLVCIVTKNKYK